MQHINDEQGRAAENVRDRLVISECMIIQHEGMQTSGV